MAVSEALSWFFSHVDQGIILEDDCIPVSDFFPFCEHFLSRLKYDKTVASVGGSNILSAKIDFNNKAFKVAHASLWGWATWADRWRLYDVNMSDWPSRRKAVLSLRRSRRMREFAKRVFDSTYDGSINSWCYQYEYMMDKYQLVCILPPVNLITNIGQGDPDSTHPHSPNNFYVPLTNGISAPYLLSESKVIFRVVNAVLEDEFLAPSRIRLSRRLVKAISWFVKRYI